MNTQQLQALLGRLTGHIVVQTPQHESQIQTLHQSLSKALLPEDIQQLKGSQFNYENADLFASDQIPAERASVLQAIAESKSVAGQEPELRVFMREVPVRSPLVHASVPGWAAGASVDHTVGPFNNKDGRQFWFDFFRIQRLVTLYVQGNANPALLFNVRTRFIVNELHLPPIPELLTTYQLAPGSIWINSQLLAQNAPAGTFTGLTIAGGTITLSHQPQVMNGQLTISPSTVVTVKLQLQQPGPAAGPDPTSPYGVDARQATLQLPKELDFEFSGQDGGTLLKVSDASWNLYGDKADYRWQGAAGDYLAPVQLILIPWNSSRPDFQVTDCQSPFFQLQGKAPVNSSAWALPVAAIDVLHPTAAAGDGAILDFCGAGLTASWKGLEGGALNLGAPGLLLEPGQITLVDLNSANVFCQQHFDLWKDAVNPFGSEFQLQFPPGSPLFYISAASGSETLMTLVNADVQADRPVDVSGSAMAIRSKKSVLILALFKAFNFIYLFDDNILADSIDLTVKPPIIPKPIALDLHNALFKVTPVNGCLLIGRLADDFIKIENGFLFLTFGLFAYLPTLPDPYAANLGPLQNQLRGRNDVAGLTQFGGRAIWMWLVCLVQWKPGTDNDTVKVSFHFAPLANQSQAQAVSSEVSLAAVQQPSLCEVLLSPVQEYNPGQVAETPVSAPVPDVQLRAQAAEFTPEVAVQGLPDYQGEWDKNTLCLQGDIFALLDVSTNADLLGISFNVFGPERYAMVRTFGVAPGSNFPLQVQGMDVVSTGNNVRAFTVPEISWEPVLNTASRVLPGDPPGPAIAGTGVLPNYYPDDGGPTRIFNNSVHLVPLAPLPLSKFIVNEYKNQPLNITSSLFTLPFGMRALATLTKFVYPYEKSPAIGFIQPKFEDNLKGGLQLEVDAGKLPTDDFPMFNGATTQINNVLDLLGNPTGASTLGQSVSIIFNDEFKLKPDPLTSRGVPLTRIDFSGYGASIFSNWFNPLAQMAQTSQSKFDVWVGRAAHEVIQVKSIIYPWGIRVVRTIILYRASTGYEYRVDTGWKAQSDGVFDFSYYVRFPTGDPLLRGEHADYEVHPGVVNGLFNIQNIVEVNNQFPTNSIIHNGEYYLDDNNFTHQNTGADMTVPALLQMVTFDADVDIEGVVQGQVNGRVPSKGIMGFVQLAPRGIPISKEAFQKLLNYQPTPIGGPLDCIVDIGQNGQKLRVSRFDVNNSLGANGTDIVFAAAIRGSVILPKDGAWSMVQHLRGTGDVTPLPDQQPVPLIRIGPLTYTVVNVDPNNQKVVLNTPDVTNSLLRLANPLELLRDPASDTLNYGFLHSTGTQKALILTPAYKLMAGAAPGAIPKLLSKTAPLFVDAFRIVNSKAIFPNVGDAETDLGDAISLFSNGTEFVQNALTDAGKQVLEVMQINQKVAGAVEEGYKLLKQVTSFDLPSGDWTLVEVPGAFKIYIHYKAENVQKADGSGTESPAGALDFDVDSFAAQTADLWKSKMQNVSIVVDLGPISSLMTIKGNWDADNGSESNYQGSDSDANFPSPQIEYAPALQPVIEILQILQDLQTGDYAAAFSDGLKLAMSNKADSWEYKFSADKEIPVVRFPTPDFLYNDPNAPFKLEAGLKLGVYFNAALMITTDPKQLLPTAGGFLDFYGRLSVMCVSISIATIYAVGQVDLKIGADTKLGPTLDMKFGFGAQIVVGLPVVGNVSVLYEVGVEIYIDKNTLAISAFMLFQGHAEILGGIVGVTITIEAKGTVSRNNATSRTDLTAEVTFGLDISIFLVIDISFSTSWSESRQIA